MSQAASLNEWLDLAQTVLSGVAGTGARVESVEPWGVGALNTCLKVVDGSGQAYFLKVENEDIIPSTRRGQIAREVASMQLMAAAGIPCPAVLCSDPSGSQTGRRYLLEAFIDADLFWEIRENITEQECNVLRTDIAAVLEKMNTITSPLFGDVYPNGAIGQHAAWPAAYLAMARLLIGDSEELGLFTAEEAGQVAAFFECCAESLVWDGPAGFYHGDLGLHNLMVDRSQGFARLGWVIDFGNALFLPAYKNEADTRQYGGFDLDLVDVESRWGVGSDECAANNLLNELDGLVFRSMLRRRRGKDVEDLKAGFLKRI